MWKNSMQGKLWPGVWLECPQKIKNVIDEPA